MANKESIQRSNILTDKATTFLAFKQEFLEKNKINVNHQGQKSSDTNRHIISEIVSDMS